MANQTDDQVDEETPLLRSEQVKKPRTPLPWFQFSIVLFLQLAEPLTAQVIYPFLPEVVLHHFQEIESLIAPLFQLIRNIGITNGDDKKVGYYVGIMVR